METTDLALPQIPPKIVDYIVVIGIILVIFFGSFAVYNNFRYLHELKNGPCKLCTDMGHWCTAPYKSKIEFIIPDDIEEEQRRIIGNYPINQKMEKDSKDIYEKQE